MTMKRWSIGSNTDQLSSFYKGYHTTKEVLPVFRLLFTLNDPKINHIANTL